MIMKAFLVVAAGQQRSIEMNWREEEVWRECVDSIEKQVKDGEIELELREPVKMWAAGEMDSTDSGRYENGRTNLEYLEMQ